MSPPPLCFLGSRILITSTVLILQGPTGFHSNQFVIVTVCFIRVFGQKIITVHLSHARHWLYTVLVKKFVQVFPLNVMEKPERTFWPT